MHFFILWNTKNVFVHAVKVNRVLCCFGPHCLSLGQKHLRHFSKYLLLCSAEESHTRTRGWFTVNDRIFILCQPSLPVVLLCPWRTADTSKHASHHKCRSIVWICKLKGTYLPVPSTCPLRADLTQSDSLDFSLLHCGWTVTMIKWAPFSVQLKFSV